MRFMRQISNPTNRIKGNLQKIVTNSYEKSKMDQVTFKWENNASSAEAEIHIKKKSTS